MIWIDTKTRTEKRSQLMAPESGAIKPLQHPSKADVRDLSNFKSDPEAEVESSVKSQVGSKCSGNNAEFQHNAGEAVGSLVRNRYICSSVLQNLVVKANPV